MSWLWEKGGKDQVEYGMTYDFSYYRYHDAHPIKDPCCYEVQTADLRLQNRLRKTV